VVPNKNKRFSKFSTPAVRQLEYNTQNISAYSKINPLGHLTSAILQQKLAQTNIFSH
jgi:hypothetical protein